MLEPVERHDDLPRTFLDENDILRADHRDRHEEGASGVRVTRLNKKIPAEDIMAAKRTRKKAG